MRDRPVGQDLTPIDHHNQHRPHRSLSSVAPLKPLPEPVDLGLCRIRRQAQVGGLINKYRLVA
jgi:putative transposase